MLDNAVALLTDPSSVSHRTQPSEASSTSMQHESLLATALLHDNILAIGIYRAARTHTSPVSYVVTAPELDLVCNGRDRAFVIR